MNTGLILLIILAVGVLGVKAYSAWSKEEEKRKENERTQKLINNLEELLKNSNMSIEKSDKMVEEIKGAFRPDVMAESIICGAQPNYITCNVAGVNMGDRKRKVSKMKDYHEHTVHDYVIIFQLVREPGNANDPNAIKVMAEAMLIDPEKIDAPNKNIGHIGYIPREVAAQLAPQMDRQKQIVFADLVSVSEFENEKGKLDYAVKIKIKPN